MTNTVENDEQAVQHHVLQSIRPSCSCSSEEPKNNHSSKHNYEVIESANVSPEFREISTVYNIMS